MSHDCLGMAERGGSAPSTLHAACVKAGLDRDGERCPDCPVRALCSSEGRWLVPVGTTNGYRR